MAGSVAGGLGKLNLDDSLDSSGDDGVPFLGTNEGARRTSVKTKKNDLDSSSSDDASSSDISSDVSSDSDASDSDDSDVVPSTTTASATTTRQAAPTRRAGGHRAAAAAAAASEPKGKGKAGGDEREREQKEKEKEAKDAAATAAAASGKKVPDYSAFVTNYEIDPRDIKLGDLLGSGSYGKVYRAKLYAKDVAVKKLTTKFLDEKALRAFGHEVNIMWYRPPPQYLFFFYL
jgi:hypothetical protein